MCRQLRDGQPGDRLQRLRKGDNGTQCPRPIVLSHHKERCPYWTPIEGVGQVKWILSASMLDERTRTAQSRQPLHISFVSRVKSRISTYDHRAAFP